MPQGILLIVAGVWLLLQTLVGDLPKRILSWRNWSPSTSTPTSTSTSSADSADAKMGGFI